MHWRNVSFFGFGCGLISYQISMISFPINTISFCNYNNVVAHDIVSFRNYIQLQVAQPTVAQSQVAQPERVYDSGTIETRKSPYC